MVSEAVENKESCVILKQKVHSAGTEAQIWPIPIKYQTQDGIIQVIYCIITHS